MTVLFFIWIFVVGLVVTAAVVGLIILPILAMSSTNPFFCNKLGWHRSKDIVISELDRRNGICKRCGKNVTKDSDGNWI